MSVSPSQPASSFDDFGLSPAIRRGITSAGFTEPRPIQLETIPAILDGRDILGLAQTGTGKTAAFGLPILEQLTATRKPGPRVLIVAPTRELASQISAELRLLGQHTRVRVATVFGGVGQGPQVAELGKHPEIVVACPGRLLDLHGQGLVRFDRIETLVLDEADHMFDMGFLPDIRRLLGALPARRQNLLFSATMPAEIRGLASSILDRPHIVDLARSQPLSTIEHALYPVEDRQKLGLLQRLVSEDGFVSAIIFTRTKHRAKRLAQKLSTSGHRAVALQGNMSQNQRNRAMEGFRRKEFDILVATDIAARGIDVAQVSHVVNFDMPNTAEAYTHRIGRTGRAEREGKAYTFVTDDDRAMVRAVERRMGKPIPRRVVEGIEFVPLPLSRPGRPAARMARPASKRKPSVKAGSRRRSGGATQARPGVAKQARHGATSQDHAAGGGSKRTRSRRSRRSRMSRAS